MKAWFMDAYRHQSNLILWFKTPDENIRLERPLRTTIYLEATQQAEEYLTHQTIPFRRVRRQNYRREWQDVFEIVVPHLAMFERFVRWIEEGTKHQVALYNADITPEQRFLYEHGLSAGTTVLLDGEEFHVLDSNEAAPFTVARLTVRTDKPVAAAEDTPIRGIELNETRFDGEEHSVLERFAAAFVRLDPDIIILEHGYAVLPHLVRRLAAHKLSVAFHRWDDTPITYKGGRTFFTYGRVRYQDYALVLHGRFLIDTMTTVGSTCSPDGILELCQLSGVRFPQVCARSFGAAFQGALVKQLLAHHFLVPFKEKPIDEPLSFIDLVKGDRAGQYLDPVLGFHQNVAEIDFSSMYPWLMFNYNISAEALQSKEEPLVDVPGLPLTVSHRHKGLVPLAIKPFLERRMAYKRTPTPVHKERAAALKWVLVSSNGYLRFREFKLGLHTSHMALCAYARETLLASMRLAEEQGFRVLHGIVDSLYLTKPGMTEEDVRRFAKDLEILTGIPVSMDGIFKWVVFLPSINDDDRALPARYYGVFTDGEIKARGLEVRQLSSARVVQEFQHEILQALSTCSTAEEIREAAPLLCRLLRRLLGRLDHVPPEWLTIKVCLSKTEYKHNVPQKAVVEAYAKRGIPIQPGQFVRYLYQESGPVIPEDYTGPPDADRYEALLTRALFIVLQPFGFSREWIRDHTQQSRQTRVPEYGEIFDNTLKLHDLPGASCADASP